jgi:putative acetyltransferase
MNITIRSEITEDRESVWNVNQTAFDGDDEANLVDALRDGGFVVASIVAELNDEIAGHILFSHVSILTEHRSVDAVSLAPMAVSPEYQRQGVGSNLVKTGLKACREHEHRIAVVLGHPDFYPRFGFSADLARAPESPFGGGGTWMAMSTNMYAAHSSTLRLPILRNNN